MSTNPRRIFNLPEQPDTAVTVQLTPHTITNRMVQSKCGWTPFHGTEVAAKVQKVVLRGEVVFEDGHILAKPGSGKLLPFS
jgi:carbamoyl-phosphate synthase/aspartate carbamoyltransferase/dihydroorotase